MNLPDTELDTFRERMIEVGRRTQEKWSGCQFCEEPGHSYGNCGALLAIADIKEERHRPALDYLRSQLRRRMVPYIKWSAMKIGGVQAV